jgi:hypothetical protein
MKFFEKHMSKTKRCFFLSIRKCTLERGNCALEKKRFDWKKRERDKGIYVDEYKSIA